MGRFLLVLLLTFLRLSLGESLLEGSREACNNEGETVIVESIKNIKCFTCNCKNGFVECHPKEECPSQEGCHVLL
uniref:Secreted Single domain von Willebrand protein n=1 Tax=Pristhesancus plagipennis TaxID=1955184 RepID=A0A2K8JPI9_PRIPG|nr:secreted Single domain von Willebrand protein [Pristhesancus plagipennis]